METLKKFIRYYSPYKAVFFLDLLCATVISVVDLVYPQLLRSLDRNAFHPGWPDDFKRASAHRHQPFSHVSPAKPV